VAVEEDAQYSSASVSRSSFKIVAADYNAAFRGACRSAQKPVQARPLAEVGQFLKAGGGRDSSSAAASVRKRSSLRRQSVYAAVPGVVP
jgi:hypothetical protein